jgi:hypothetical protein
MSNKWIASHPLVFGVIIFMGMVFAGAAGVVTVNEMNRQYEQRVLTQSIKLIDTIPMGGAHFYHCADENLNYLIDLYIVYSPNKIGILAGPVTDRSNNTGIYEHVFSINPGQQNVIVLGCFKVVVIKDPNDIYLLEIYGKP